jgi:glycosyltransferase involved in cell wall biosynthesis
MILGIDASNIRRGGGVTHLVELLRAADPVRFGFSKVIVWAGQQTMDEIEDRPWLAKAPQKELSRHLVFRVLWQRFKLSEIARAASCDLLFVPGGSYAGDFRPTVAFSQNLLPFEWGELRRFGWSPMTLKLLLLRLVQSRTFRQAKGVIFLTEYAREAVIRVTGPLPGRGAIIPHGTDKQFVRPPREQLPIERYSAEFPFRLLYVSTVDMYKHQWHVAAAVADLRRRGLPVALDLVGPAYGPALRRLMRVLQRVDPKASFIRYCGVVPYDRLPAQYAGADLFVFASSCETFGQILTEAMSEGLPVACSNRSALPEVLKDAGVYFDPEDPMEIGLALEALIVAPELRAEKARAAFQASQAYSWSRCANASFEFLAEVARPAPGRNG